MRKGFLKQTAAVHAHSSTASCTTQRWHYLKLLAPSYITPADHTCPTLAVLSLPYRGTGDTSVHATWNSRSFAVTTILSVHSEVKQCLRRTDQTRQS